jgi:hypothetical protein
MEPIMRAERLEDATIAVCGATRTETFNRIWAGVGWPEKNPGCVCVVGERTNGLYHCLWEKLGGLKEIGESIISAKDRFLVDRVWVDGRDELATSYLRTLDGLCFYEDRANLARSLDAAIPKRHWPSLSDPETTAAVVAVPDRVVSNFRSALEKTRAVIMTGSVVIHESGCPRLVYTLRQPLNDLMGSPIMKALVWVISALDRSS